MKKVARGMNLRQDELMMQLQGMTSEEEKQMIFYPTRKIFEYLSALGETCRIVETDDYSAVEVKYRKSTIPDNPSIYFLSQDNDGVTVMVTLPRIVVSDEKRDNMLRAINEANQVTTFPKFYLTDDRIVMASCAVPNTTENLDQVAYEVFLFFADAINAIYPKLVACC